MPIPEYPAQSRREPAKGETVSPERRHLKGPFHIGTMNLKQIKQEVQDGQTTR
jgi:hypothetical protein